MKSKTINEYDRNNIDGILIIAAELLYDINIYEWSLLNPINFILISVLELGIKNSPKNNTLRYWLVKMLSKLGLSGRMSAVA